MPKKRKSSRRANFERRMRRIRNGMGQARPDSPVFVRKGLRLVKLTRKEYDRLEEEAASLSYFAGYQITAEQLIKLPRRHKTT